MLFLILEKGVVVKYNSLYYLIIFLFINILDYLCKRNYIYKVSFINYEVQRYRFRRYIYLLSEQFSNYIFIDKGHKYLDLTTKERGLSSTTRIGQFTEPFDALTISLAMCKQDVVQASNLRNQWTAKALRGTTRGTFLHYFMECLLQRKIITVDNHVRSLEPNINDYILVCRDYYLKYYQSEIKDINIQSEIVISNGYLFGQIDNLSYRPNVGYIIKDWKFDLEFTTESKYNFKGDLSHLDTSKLNKYSLQTRLYERMLGIKIAAIELVHITPDGYNIYNPKDFIKEIDILLDTNSKTFDKKKVKKSKINKINKINKTNKTGKLISLDPDSTHRVNSLL